MEEKRPSVGISIIILNKGKILLGKRKGSHGTGTWASPGGHMEMYETFDQTAKKEVKEETNLNVELIDKNPVVITNDFFKDEGKHYITLFFRARIISGELKLLEPNKAENWKWFSWKKLPQPLFIPLQNLIKQRYNPF